MLTTNSSTLQALLDIALDLAQQLSTDRRYERLIEAVSEVVPCDACSLMRYQEGELVPLAVHGLTPQTIQTRFLPSQHPRLRAILEAEKPVRFAADDPRPDPFDGLLTSDDGPHLRLHSCMGAPLYVNETLVGALTIDALTPGAFEAIADEEFEFFAALAAATMHTAGLIESLQRTAAQRGEVARDMVREALRRKGGQLVGRSRAMRRLRDELAVVADSDLAVLLTGETGSGKDLAARMVHARSPRAEKPLVYVNCAALPESMAESELFGHVRGAFTGAVSERAGKFELADGGTLFLDEIGELPMSIQPKLLRALQSGEVQRVGSDRNIQVDVRILAATNRNLRDAVRRGGFRVDLYHRLSVYPIEVPPLRDREEDILLLAEHFADLARGRLGLGPVRFSGDARRALQRYRWPGNVRELHHVVQRAALRATGGRRRAAVTIHPSHLGLDLAAGSESRPLADDPAARPVDGEGMSLREAVDAFQRDLLARTLEETGGNLSEAARRLQMDRGNLHRLAARLGLREA